MTYTKVDLAIGLLQSPLEVGERLEARFLELGDPALVDLLQGHRVEEVQLLAAAPHGGDQVSRLQQFEVLRHALPRHVQVFAQLVERAAVVRMQQIQQLAPAGIGQRLEQQIGVTAVLGHRQAFTCMNYRQV